MRAGRGGIEIVDVARGTDPVTQVPDEPIRVVQALEQMVRWRQIIDLDNPSTRLTGVTVPRIVSDEAGRSVPIEPSPGAEVLIEYGSDGAPVFTVEVRNRTKFRSIAPSSLSARIFGVVSLLDGGRPNLSRESCAPRDAANYRRVVEGGRHAAHRRHEAHRVGADSILGSWSG